MVQEASLLVIQVINNNLDKPFGQKLVSELDDVTIVFLALVAFFIGLLSMYFGYHLFKFIGKKLFNKAAPDKQHGTSEVESRAPEGLRGQMEKLAKEFDIRREQYRKKVKNIFSNTFKTLLTLGLLLIYAQMYHNFKDEMVLDFMHDIFAWFLVTLVFVLFISGPYSLIRSAIIWSKFDQEFKSELIPRFLRLVDAKLTFDAEGISRAEYMEANLCPVGRDGLSSQDRLQASSDRGGKIVISKCQTSSTYHDDHVDRNKQKHNSRTLFRGLMVSVELPGLPIRGVIKIIPTAVVEYNRLVRKEGYNQANKIIQEVYFSDTRLLNSRSVIYSLDNLSRVDGHFVDGKYQIYADHKDEARKVINEKFEKIVAYLDQQYSDGEVLISVLENKLFIAINVDTNSFKVDTDYLKKSLLESKTMDRLYNEVTLVRQLIKEINLFAAIR